MTLQELITDLKAAGANENTVKLAMNCYELGKGDGVDAEWVARRTQHAVEAEREACAKLIESMPPVGVYRQLERATFKDAAIAIRARSQQ